MAWPLLRSLFISLSRLIPPYVLPLFCSALPQDPQIIYYSAVSRLLRDSKRFVANWGVFFDVICSSQTIWTAEPSQGIKSSCGIKLQEWGCGWPGVCSKVNIFICRNPDLAFERCCKSARGVVTPSPTPSSSTSRLAAALACDAHGTLSC